MLCSFGEARVVMSWRRNRAANELKVDRTKKARVALMISFFWATLPRSRCRSRSSTRGARVRRHLSGCVPARVPWRRRNGGTRHRAGRRCNRCRRRDSRGRAGTGDKGKSARSRKSRNRPAWPAPGRRSIDRDISAIWDQARCVFARRFLSLHPPPRKRGRGTTLRSRVVEGAQAATKLKRRRASADAKFIRIFFHEQTKNLTAVILLQRRRSGTASAPSTTVRSFRELQWSPSPAVAGAEGASDPVLAMRLHPSFAAGTKATKVRLQIK
jgi:hypothetical protein